MTRLIIICVVLIWTGCSLDHSDSKYLRWVGDSTYDIEIDSTEFQLCNSEKLVKQYFHFDKGLQYKGEKKNLVAQFNAEYIPVDIKQSGWVRIRFIVNCSGETGRFRISSSDLNYQEQEFDKRITNQLMKITKSLDGWGILTKRDKPKDYYQYLIIKIEHGRIKDILP